MAFPQDRFKLNPRLFEETISEILRRMGYETILTPRSGDKGRDVIASIITPAAPVLMLVECKRYAPHRLVGPEPIARIWTRLFEDKANLAMVITTSGFQPVASREAHSKGYQLSLKDGEQFIDWIRKIQKKQP
jgi:restriction system protein